MDPIPEVKVLLIWWKTLVTHKFVGKYSGCFNNSNFNSWISAIFKIILWHGALSLWKGFFLPWFEVVFTNFFLELVQKVVILFRTNCCTNLKVIDWKLNRQDYAVRPRSLSFLKNISNVNSSQSIDDLPKPYIVFSLWFLELLRFLDLLHVDRLHGFYFLDIGPSFYCFNCRWTIIIHFKHSLMNFFWRYTFQK